MIPEQRLGDQYLLLRDPLFVTTSIADEARLWASEHHVKIARAVAESCSALGIKISKDAFLPRFSSGERAVAALVLMAEICRLPSSPPALLLLQVHRHIDQNRRGRVADYLAGLNDVSVLAADTEGRDGSGSPKISDLRVMFSGSGDGSVEPVEVCQI